MERSRSIRKLGTVTNHASVNSAASAPGCASANRSWPATWRWWSNWATPVEEAGGKPVTIAGCALVRFRADGLVAEARDYWNLADGHRQPTGAEFLAEG